MSMSDDHFPEVKTQYQQSNFLDQREAETTRQESGISTVERQGSRRSYLYGRGETKFKADMDIYKSGVIESKKLRGQDTRYDE